MNLENILEKIEKKKPLLSEENNFLFQKKAECENSNSRKIIEEMIYMGNEYYVYKLTNKYKNIREYDDILQEAKFALVSSIQHYGPNMDCSFYTYLQKAIHNSIITYYLCKEFLIKIPESIFDKQIYDTLQILSLNVNTNKDEEEIEYIDLLKSNSNTEDEALQNYVHNALWASLELLPDLEKNIIIDRFGLLTEKPLTIEECSKKYNLHPSKVYRLERKALITLRKSNEIKYLGGKKK